MCVCVSVCDFVSVWVCEPDRLCAQSVKGNDDYEGTRLLKCIQTGVSSSEMADVVR